MSARKLSRFAGLVFVLAVILGGTGAAASVDDHAATGECAATGETAATKLGTLTIEWD